MNLNLQEFCADKSRPKLSAPFSRPDEFTYATDGKITIRVPVIQSIAAGDVKAECLFDGAREKCHGCSASIPHLPPPEIQPCEICDGLGASKECPICKGKGDIYCDHCGESRECIECDGSGDVCCLTNESGAEICDVCDGSGQVQKPATVDLMGVLFNAEYLRKIASLPQFHFFPPFKKTDAAFFTFEGGEGLLMPTYNPN